MYHLTRLLSLSLIIYLSTAQDGTPKFPRLTDIAESFESNVEVTDKMRDTTALVNEYYDSRDKTGRLDYLALGRKFSVFYDENQDQMFVVNDTACTEEDGTVFELKQSMNYENWTSAKPMFAGPSGLILAREKNPPDFFKTTSVRGITCNWFKYESKDTTVTFSVDYYFSVPNWQMPYKSENKQFPVRIDVNYNSPGKVELLAIDYLYFRPKFNDKNKLQPPPGLGCTMRKPYVKLPAIPNQYTFSSEGFDLLHDKEHADTDVTLGTVWYDYKAKYARLDSYTEDGMISDLYDFNTGVTYHTHDHATCVILALRNKFFLHYEADTLVRRMKEPKEVLNLQGDDETYYSLGQADVRGVECNVFEKVEHNVEVQFFGQTYYKLVTTVYFPTATTKFEVEGEKLEKAPPLDIILTGYSDNSKVSLKRQFQIFSFNDEPGRLFFASFPVDSCFSKTNQKAYFAIMLDATPEIAAQIEVNATAFNIEAKSVIINTANITELRLPFVKTDFSESGIYLNGLMLDKPHILTQFYTELDEPMNVTNPPAYVKDAEAQDEESCAASCVTYTEPCKGFYFCETNCYIMLSDITEKPVEKHPIDEMCMIYIRAVSDSNNAQDSLEQAIKNLVAEKDKGKLLFPAMIGSDNEVLTAVEVVSSYSNRGGDSVNDYPYTLVKAGYQFKEKSKTATVDAPGVDTEDDCYRQCKRADTISCSSFSYCPKTTTKLCRLSSVLLTDSEKDNSEIDANKECDIFQLLYLDLYEPYPGKSLIIEGEKTLAAVESTEECAKNCKEEQSFKCRGFEFCKSKNTCVLHSKHVLDVKPEDTKPAQTQCVHYAARYSADYRDMGEKLIDDESNVRNEITLEECARACSEEVSDCVSFNYCPPTSGGTADSTCSMTSKTLYSNPPQKVKEKCRLYTQRDNIEDWRPGRRPTPDISGYTPGAFAGLLIGMVILGLVVGALLFVGYSYFRSRRSDDGMTVKFSKQDNM